MRHPDGTTTHYGWDGVRIVREETDQKRTTVVYEPGSFVPMLRIDDTPQGQVLSAYVTDALGTPMQLVNAHGKTAWQAQPDDWAATQPIRFQGQWHDEESGLYYNRHRYYDPKQGRYISQDPIGLNGGTNLYGYVANPTRMVDPLGLYGSPFNRPGRIDRSGRHGYTGPGVHSGRPAPRSALEKSGNFGLNKLWGKITGGFSEINTSTGAIVKSNPYVWGGWALVEPSKISTLQTRNYDGDDDGLSDEHYQLGMCSPGAR